MTYVQKNIQNYVTKQQLSLGELAFLHQLSVKHLSSKRGVKYSILLTNNSGPAVQQIVFDSFSFTTCWCWLIYICKHTVFLYQADFFVVADSFTPLNKPSGKKCLLSWTIPTELEVLNLIHPLAIMLTKITMYVMYTISSVFCSSPLCG